MTRARESYPSRHWRLVCRPGAGPRRRFEPGRGPDRLGVGRTGVAADSRRHTRHSTMASGRVQRGRGLSGRLSVTSGGHARVVCVQCDAQPNLLGRRAERRSGHTALDRHSPSAFAQIGSPAGAPARRADAVARRGTSRRAGRGAGLGRAGVAGRLDRSRGCCLRVRAVVAARLAWRHGRHHADLRVARRTRRQVDLATHRRGGRPVAGAGRRLAVDVRAMGTVCDPRCPDRVCLLPAGDVGRPALRHQGRGHDRCGDLAVWHGHRRARDRSVRRLSGGVHAVPAVRVSCPGVDLRTVPRRHHGGARRCA